MTAPIEKIKKLLNLSENNPNEHEAAAALAQAQALMARYGIEKLDRSEPIKAEESGSTDYQKRWQYICGQAAAVLYGCECVTSSRTAEGPDGLYVVLDIFYFIGRPENNQASMVTQQYIEKQIEGLYKQYLPKGMSKSERARYRRDFKQHAAIRVWNRANSIIKERQSQDSSAQSSTGHNALVVKGYYDTLKEENRLLSEKLGLVTKKNRKVSRKLSRGVVDGSSAGSKVNLNPGIERQHNLT